MAAVAAAVRRIARRLRRLPPGLLLVVPAAALLYVLVLIPFTPTVEDLRKGRTEQPSVMVAADGMVLAQFKGANREWQPLRRISPHVVAALISTEDHRFYQHPGLDFRRTAAALMSTLAGDRQGGSTITQQLARNMYPQQIGRAPTVTRKVKEALAALRMEARYSKQEILETYLNTVPFLYNAFGIEMAARTYFGKSAARLDVLESATLVGMLKGTSYYNPVLNPRRSLERRNLVLARMAQHGHLSGSALAALQARPLRLEFEQQREPLGPAPHLAQHVRSWLVEWADRNDHDIHADGLVVRTTLHGPLQLAANAAVQLQLARLQPLASAQAGGRPDAAPLQAGFLALDPRSGQVRAWVGSRDFTIDQFDHVRQARRQPGSTFKPFVYGAAFGKGLRPSDTLIDQPVTIKLDGGEVWQPRDPTPATGRPMTLADGLAYSRNSITVQLMEKAGPARVAQLAQAMGVRESRLEKVPSLALGTSPVTLREMVASYGTIANGGDYIEPVVVTQVEDRAGRVLEAFAPPTGEAALEGPHALMLLDALRGVIDRGTGKAIRDRYGIRADVAGKTGTTQENTDGWFILMHARLVGGAWVGFNDSRITMGDSWGPGASSALPIVAEVFQQALRRGWIDPRARLGTPPAAAPPESGPLAGTAVWLSRLLGSARDEADRTRETARASRPRLSAETAPPPGRELGADSATPRAVLQPQPRPRSLQANARNAGRESDDQDEDEDREEAQDEDDDDDEDEGRRHKKKKNKKWKKQGKHGGKWKDD